MWNFVFINCRKRSTTKSKVCLCVCLKDTQSLGNLNTNSMPCVYDHTHNWSWKCTQTNRQARPGHSRYRLKLNYRARCEHNTHTHTSTLFTHYAMNAIDFSPVPAAVSLAIADAHRSTPANAAGTPLLSHQRWAWRFCCGCTIKPSGRDRMTDKSMARATDSSSCVVGLCRRCVCWLRSTRNSTAPMARRIFSFLSSADGTNLWKR